MPRPIVAVLAALIASTVPAAAQTATTFGGLKADVKAPVEVSSDALSVNQADGSATFTGNVVIGQGTMRLSAAEVKVVYAGQGQNRIQSLTATGGEYAAEAKQAVYEVEAGEVTLTGDVIVTRGENVLSGERMVVDLAKGTAAVEGRVRSVFRPDAD